MANAWPCLQVPRVLSCLTGLKDLSLACQDREPSLRFGEPLTWLYPLACLARFNTVQGQRLDDTSLLNLAQLQHYWDVTRPQGFAAVDLGIQYNVEVVSDTDEDDG